MTVSIIDAITGALFSVRVWLYNCYVIYFQVICLFYNRSVIKICVLNPLPVLSLYVILIIKVF